MKNHAESGFTLLEVMVALAILAMGLGAITFANNTSMLQLAATNRMIEASFLLEGVVEDIQSYYESNGFPTNSLEGQQCELPPDMGDTFECHYDLDAIELTPEAITALAQVGTESLMGAMQGQTGVLPGMQGAGTGTGAVAGAGLNQNLLTNLQQPLAGTQNPAEENEKTTKKQKTAIQNQLKRANFSKMALLAPLFGPQGKEIMAICNINMSVITMGLAGMMSFLPMVVQKIGERVRKLTLHLQWKEGPKAGKTLTVETFIVSLPEEEVQKMKEEQEAREAGQELQQQRGPTSSAPNLRTKAGNTNVK